MQVKFFILPESLLQLESLFHTANCLKSFDFKLFFVYALRKPPLAHLHIIFAVCSKINDWLQSLLNAALEWFTSFLTKQCRNYKCEILKGGPTTSLKKGVLRRPFRWPPLLSTHVYVIAIASSIIVAKNSDSARRG